MNILILGASGLLGNAMFRVLSQYGSDSVWGTIRDENLKHYFTPELADQLITVRDLEDKEQLVNLIDDIHPDVIINCLALSRGHFSDPIRMISIFSLFPRRLHHLCREYGIRLIQVSSDGVFSGKKGRYTEHDFPDANDPYGVAKLLGEVDGPGSLTLRTSIIGHELNTHNGLLEWFLQQDEECRCYANAIFSGFPTVVLAQIVRDIVLPNANLQGIYHLASAPISKYELLSLVALEYDLSTRLIPDNSVVIDRSLCAERFNRDTGYVAPNWADMVATMHSYKFGLKEH